MIEFQMYIDLCESNPTEHEKKLLVGNFTNEENVCNATVTFLTDNLVVDPNMVVEAALKSNDDPIPALIYKWPSNWPNLYFHGFYPRFQKQKFWDDVIRRVPKSICDV